MIVYVSISLLGLLALSIPVGIVLFLLGFGIDAFFSSFPLTRGPNNGYVDRFGNEWVKGPPRTKGEAYEWDVQLSRVGKNMLGWASRDGRHLNVSLTRRLTH